jgi:hypothetical protein
MTVKGPVTMIRNEEHAIRLATLDGVQVDGIVRARSLSVRVRRGGGAGTRDRYAHLHMVGRGEPVAVVIHRGEAQERIPITSLRVPRVLLFAALPVAARLAARMLVNQSRRNA